MTGWRASSETLHLLCLLRSNDCHIALGPDHLRLWHVLYLLSCLLKWRERWVFSHLDWPIELLLSVYLRSIISTLEIGNLVIDQNSRRSSFECRFFRWIKNLSMTWFQRVWHISECLLLPFRTISWSQRWFSYERTSILRYTWWVTWMMAILLPKFSKTAEWLCLLFLLIWRLRSLVLISITNNLNLRLAWDLWILCDKVVMMSIG